MKHVPLSTPKDRWRLPPGASLVTCLGCRSKSAVDRLPRMWNFSSSHCGHTSWCRMKDWEPSQGLTSMSSFSEKLLFPCRRCEQSWLLSSPLFLLHLWCSTCHSNLCCPLRVLRRGRCCCFWLQLPVCAHTRETWQHVCLCCVVVHHHCTGVAVRSRSKRAVGSERRVCTPQASPSAERIIPTMFYLQISCLQKCSPEQNTMTDSFSFWFLIMMMSVWDLWKNKLIININVSYLVVSSISFQFIARQIILKNSDI